MSNENVGEFLSHFVLDLFQNHQRNRGYNLAFRSAIQSDRKLHDAHNEKVIFFFKERVQNLREINDNFKQISEKRLTDVFVFMYNLVNAIIYHHLSVMELFDTDNEFVNYLAELAAFSLEFYYKKQIQ